MRHYITFVCKTKNCRLFCVTAATAAWVNSSRPDYTVRWVVSPTSQSSLHRSGPLCDGKNTRSHCTPSSLWAMNEGTGPCSPERGRLIIADCSRCRCMDLSHAQMTVIWSRRNTGLSAGRGLLLFSGEDGYSFLLLAFHYNSFFLVHLLHTHCAVSDLL